MNFAIYARKSIYSDKSDSIKNQIRMCHEYIDMKYSDVGTILEYCDEGLTGANTNRPELQRLLADISDGLVDMLAVYQLDRLSRDVRDFSNIYGLLTEKRVEFISVKENIDTSTPIGKAMTYITMVFAQLERESIAQRVTDNMIGLAKKGYWTGGNPPYGYVRQRITVDGKKHVTIVPDPDAVKWVQDIYKDFLENGYSLQGMETAYKHAGIRTQNGKFFSTTQLHKILTMPYCVQDTGEVYDYYKSLGCNMDSDRSEWDGTHGVMIYGRSTEKHKKHQIQPKSEWLVCIGHHEPFMDADTWLEAQKRFAQNKFEKKKKYDIPLLKGTLRCAKCGGLMQVSRKKLAHGNVLSSYYCLKRMRQGTEACDMSAIKCDLLDNAVLDIFKGIEADPELIRKYIDKSQIVDNSDKIKELEKEASKIKARIDRLTENLADGSGAAKFIVQKIESENLTLEAIQAEIERERAEKKRIARSTASASERAENIGIMIRELSGLTADEKNQIVKDVVQECTWDGDTLFLRL